MSTNNTVYKYRLENERGSDGHAWSCLLPIYAKIVTVDGDPNTEMFVWAEVLSGEARTQRCTVHVYGTGWPLDLLRGTYLRTIHLPNGEHWHCYA